MTLIPTFAAPPSLHPPPTPHRYPQAPTCAHTPPKPASALRHIKPTLAATALALTLLQTNVSPTPHINLSPTHAEPTQTDSQTDTPLPDNPTPNNTTAAQRKQLREISRRNTRASGKSSQTFSLARRAAEAGDLTLALSKYDELISQTPTFAPAWSNRANIYVARGMYGRALHDYTEALRLAPLDTDAWVLYINRGATRMAMGEDAAKALEDMNVAYELRGDDEMVLSNRAGVYEAMGKWDNAIRDYQRALKSNDVRPFWERYGLVLFQRNKGYEAVSILKRVAARYDVSDVHAALAVIYFERGELGLAEAEWSAVDRPRSFESRAFLEEVRKWPPRAVEGMDKFRRLTE